MQPPASGDKSPSLTHSAATQSSRIVLCAVTRTLETCDGVPAYWRQPIPNAPLPKGEMDTGAALFRYTYSDNRTYWMTSGQATLKSCNAYQWRGGAYEPPEYRGVCGFPSFGSTGLLILPSQAQDSARLSTTNTRASRITTGLRSGGAVAIGAASASAGAPSAAGFAPWTACDLHSPANCVQMPQFEVTALPLSTTTPPPPQQPQLVPAAADPRDGDRDIVVGAFHLQ